MALFGRKRNRVPPTEWPLPLIADNVVGAYVSDPDGDDARAAAIFHLNPNLIPADMAEIVREEADQWGYEFEGLKHWTLFKLEFAEDKSALDSDRVGLYMEHDATAVIRESYACDTFEQADQEAQQWLETWDYAPVPFRGLPGVFQTAVVVAVSGKDLEPMPADLMWVLGQEGRDEWLPVRRFPPPANEPQKEGRWSLLPRPAVEGLLEDRGW